ncbi:MAG: cytidylate kinase-like family protein [Eubacteriales bacterium]|nr:cytidylate kinase-like family protein [Eubacteriales bacterium]
MEEKKQLIISVGREFGSGGHEIAEELAKRFHLPFYDYHLIGEIAAGKKIDVKTLERFDELPKIPFFSRTVKGYSNSPQENIANMQFEYLKKKAAAGESFVIVGRCSETILKGNPGLISIFVLGDIEAKVDRVTEREHVSRIEAEEMIARHDRKRKTYHNHYCRGKWGDSRNYDISINSSKLGTLGTVDMLEEYIRRRIGK